MFHHLVATFRAVGETRPFRASRKLFSLSFSISGSFPQPLSGRSVQYAVNLTDTVDGSFIYLLDDVEEGGVRINSKTLSVQAAANRTVLWECPQNVSRKLFNCYHSGK